MHLREVTIDRDRFPTQDSYPFNLSVFRNSRSLDLSSPVTLFVGENGTGKSTLLQALCRRCNVHIWEGMYRARSTANRYENMLPGALNIRWNAGPVPGSFFSPELFRNFSQLVDEWAVNNPELLTYFGGDSLVTQSHGQSTMAYFRSIYKIRGVHFLDEPEAALSPRTQLKLLALLTDMSRAGHAQFIISTHSPILMSLNQAMLYSFDNDAIETTSYYETSHFKVYKRFFNAVQTG